MAFSSKTTKMLWGKAAALCSMPDCRRALVFDETEEDAEATLGEMCHIVAEADDGPRPDPTMPLEERNAYRNLILMCRNHHREIDAQENTWPVARLHQIKAEHEQWVKASLPNYDAARQKDDEIYAAYVDYWVEAAGLDTWTAWSSFVLGSGLPRIRESRFDALSELQPWIIKRIWPGRHKVLEDAFHNFRRVLHDFQDVFARHISDGHPQAELLFTEKFYKSRGWLPEGEYRTLLEEFEDHVALVMDLMMELTRAANHLCAMVRLTLLPSFRLKEGYLSVEWGPHMPDMSWKMCVPQYSEGEIAAAAQPYPGLAAFDTARRTRDIHFG